MPGFLLNSGATVQCMHAGQAQPAAPPNSRVKVDGQPIVTKSNTYTVTGCSFNPPCATAQWMSFAKRVRAGGVPVLLQDSQAACAPTGTGLNISVKQTRVKGM